MTNPLQVIWDDIQAEPVNAQAFAQALLGWAAAYGLHLDGTQQAAWMTLTAVGLAFFTRKGVTPNVSVPPQFQDPPPKGSPP